MKNVKYISASAGSGKTYTLTETLAKAIQNGDVEPENVILTTFTKAAASEFKEKAKAMLYENGLVIEADRLDQAMIGTIHSVAEAFINKYWYVIGLSPKINPIAEEDLDFFRNQSLVNLLTEEEVSFLNKFAEEFKINLDRSKKLNYDFWKEDLSKILEYSKNYQIKDYKPSIDYSKEMTRSLVQGGYHIKVNFDLLEEILNKAEQLNEADESDEQEELRKSIRNQKRWMRFKEPSSLRYANEINEFVKSLPWKELEELKAEFSERLLDLYSSEEVRELLNKYIDLLFSLAERWSIQYEEYKKEHHLIDFSDMEEYFYKLLANNEVAADIKATYKYVFVDEFQDCSPIQVMIFDRLSDIVEHSIWVGDKKQAIYGFRGSDTVLTTAVMDIVKENEKLGIEGCSTDILSNSWRSLPEIVNFTNAVFTKGFSNEAPEAVRLIPKRKDGKGFVGYWWLDGKNAELRYEALTSNIISLIKNGEKPSDIAILASTNPELSQMANFLRNAKIPVFIDEGGLAGTETVTLITSLLELIVDETAQLPKAQIAFLTEENYKLGKILDDKIEYNQIENPDYGFYDEIPLVKKVLAEQGRYKLQPVAALVESLIVELDLYNIVKKLNDNVDTTKLLHAIIDTATTYENHCVLMHLPSTILGFIAYLSENGVSVTGSNDGVQLFTFHRSKGLEWKTVILLSCEKDFLNPSTFIKRNIFGTRIIHVTESTKEKLFPEVVISLFPNLFSGNKNVAKEWLDPLQKAEKFNELVLNSKEEKKRLMYVAMTRPRDNLIIALCGKKQPMLLFTQLGYDVSEDFQEEACDLLNSGVVSVKLDNAPIDIKYDYVEEKNIVADISGTADENAVCRNLQPSSISGGKVKPSVYDKIVPVTVKGKYNSAALGTCIHNIFCSVDKKTEQEIAQMVKISGFEKNLPVSSEIKNAWKSLTEYLTENYGKAVKQYHELPFKQLLDNEQIVTGSMDFVWETSEGCVVVDYKTFPGKKEELLDEASEYYVGKYKGQLECYKNVLKASGQNVISTLLFYPVIGLVIEI